MKLKQLKLLKNEPLAYGGVLRNSRKGRFARPLDTKNTNEKKILGVIEKFSKKYAVKIISMANVGNHLHFQIKLSNRFGYKPFIRAITSAIAMKITGFAGRPTKKKTSNFGIIGLSLESYWGSKLSSSSKIIFRSTKSRVTGQQK